MKEPELDPEIKLNGWCTIKDLAANIQKPTMYISANIKRNRIPVRVIAELNDLKLVPADWKVPDRKTPPSN